MILRASRYRIIEAIPAVLALAFGWARAALALEAPDFQPPRIEIVAPVPDSIVRESRPQIVLILRDEESGLDPAGFRLVLDRADLSREIEVAVAPDGTATVSLTPAAPLRPGPHQVWFQAQDKAGNPAHAAWNFTVEEAGPPLGFRLSGRSVTELTLQPLQHLTESLHLAVELKLGAGVLGPLVIEGAVQLDAATDYVGFGQPFSRFAPEIGDYTIGVRGARAEALFGSVLVEFPALMLFPQTTSDGMLFLWDGKGPSGGPAFNLSGFGGRAVSSYGFSLASFQYGGFAARAAWEEGRRLLLVAAETEESDCARLYLLGGETPLGGGWRLHVEGAGSRAEDSASDGYALYAGLRGGTAAAWLNLSLWRAGADFATPLLLPTLAGKGGTGRAALDGGMVLGRVAASINAFQTWNNLDEAAPDAEDAAGILLGLSFLPTGNLTYTAKCQVAEERPSPGAAAGARRLITTLSGGVDYLGHPGGRETRGGLRCSASFAGETEAPDTAAALFVSRVYEAGALAAALEQSACRGVGDSLRLALTWRPQVSFRFFGLSPRLTGEIGASWRRKRPATEVAADWSEEVGLSARLELALTAADTLCLTGAYTWAEYDDYTLKMEYRRMI